MVKMSIETRKQPNQTYTPLCLGVGLTLPLAILACTLYENGIFGIGVEKTVERLRAELANVPFVACVIISLLGYHVVVKTIPAFSEKFIEAGLFGIDLSKRTTVRDKDGKFVRGVDGKLQGVKVPEAVGVLCGVAYCFCVTSFLPFAFASTNWIGPRHEQTSRLSLTKERFPVEGAELKDMAAALGITGKSDWQSLNTSGISTSGYQESYSIFKDGGEGYIEDEDEKSMAAGGKSASLFRSISGKILDAINEEHSKGDKSTNANESDLSEDATKVLVNTLAREAADSQSQHAAFTRIIQFLASILSICSMCFLGFVDNVLNLRWRDKLVLPTLASLPILLVYFATIGTTSVLLPLPIRFFVPFDILNLGPLFYVFLLGIAIFCTNAINIYAGVNGLEAGQSLIIAVSLILNNLIQLIRLPDDFQLGRERHLFSIYILLPFVATTLGLLKYNWYPSKVFVGDAYCYFSGMTLAVAGIFGHYSKTLMLFMLPQLLNFVYGLPQLLKFIPCPRHRLPAYDVETDRSCNSFAEFRYDELKNLGKVCFKIYKQLGLAKVVEITIPADASVVEGVVVLKNASSSIGGSNANDTNNLDSKKDGKENRTSSRKTSGKTDGQTKKGSKGQKDCPFSGKSYRMSNLTLINFAIYILGPRNEGNLVQLLLCIQVIFSAFAFWIRYFVSAFVYTKVL